VTAPDPLPGIDDDLLAAGDDALAFLDQLDDLERDADKHDRLWGLVDMWRDKAAEARAEEKVAPQHDANEACGRARALDEAATALVETVSAAPPERGPAWAADGSRDSVWVSPASVRAAALHRIEQREAMPGNPADGPYPASVGEVADELAGLVVELDAGPARGLARGLAARLTEREAPSRDPGMFEAQLRKLIADTVRDLPALRAQEPYSQMLDHSARATDQIVDGVRRLMDGEQLFPVSSGISREGGQE
jgi:hypothetical protein